jgi:hypothetical protein
MAKRARTPNCIASGVAPRFLTIKPMKAEVIHIRNNNHVTTVFVFTIIPLF